MRGLGTPNGGPSGPYLSKNLFKINIYSDYYKYLGVLHYLNYVVPILDVVSYARACGCQNINTQVVLR